MTRRHKAIIATHVILIKDKKVLLTRRYGTGWADGLFSLPAGHVEAGETVRQASVREAQEEVGVEINIDDLEFAHVMYRQGDDQERTDFFFTCTTWKGEPYIAEPDKCDLIEWCLMEDLPAETVPYIKAAFQNLNDHRTYSEFNWS